MIPTPLIPDNSQQGTDSKGFFVSSWFTFFQGLYRAIQRSVGLTNVTVSSDFPIARNVQTGLTQCLILATVTDNDPTRTNTGQSFNVGDLIIWNGTNWTNIGGGASGSVASVSVVSANGFSGSVANPTITPAITLTTTITGILKGNGTAISQAFAVTPKTNGSGSPYGITAGDNSTIFTNEGASAEVYLNLPAAASGLIYTAYCQNVNGIRFVANTGDTIRVSSAVSAAAGYASSTTIGSTIILTAINATEWVAISAVGVWTVV